jgi:hypothetical protein
LLTPVKSFAKFQDLPGILALPCRRVHEDIIVDGGEEKSLRDVVLPEEITFFHKDDVE